MTPTEWLLLIAVGAAWAIIVLLWGIRTRLDRAIRVLQEIASRR